MALERLTVAALFSKASPRHLLYAAPSITAGCREVKRAWEEWLRKVFGEQQEHAAAL